MKQMQPPLHGFNEPDSGLGVEAGDLALDAEQAATANKSTVIRVARIGLSQVAFRDDVTRRAGPVQIRPLPAVQAS